MGMKIKSKAIIASMVVMLVIILTEGILLAFASSETTNKTEISTTTIAEKLEQANELVSNRYTYTNVDRYQNTIQFNTWDIPLTEKSFILSYEGEVLLGTDLKKAKISIDAQTKTIEIEVEPTKIISHTIKEDSFQLYDEKSSLFNPISVTDYQEFAIKQKKRTEEKMNFDEFDENTKNAIIQIMKLVVPEEYEVYVTVSEKKQN